MSATRRSAGARPATTRAVVGRGAVVAVLSLLLGGATNLAQTVLPGAAAPFANSASGWTFLTVLLVAWSRLRTRPAAVLGAVSFVLLVLGYTVVTDLRSLHYNPMLFGVVGVIAGPFVGAATAWLREDPLRAAAGTALLAGIGVGESLYGLTHVADTTEPHYWVVVGVLGLVLLAGMLAGQKVRGPRPVALALAGTAVVAGAFVLAYANLHRVALL